MRGYSGWNYAPYRPFMTEVGDIYICRIVPSTHAIHFEWLDVGETCEVFCRKRGEGDFACVGKTAKTEFDIVGLETETDYEFYVCAGDKKSRIRLARAGESIGTVITYLHPEDDAYLFSGRYLSSPSLVRHPQGHLLASLDIFASGCPQNLTLVYRSDDDGKTWKYVNELMPCFWGLLFIHKGELYMLSMATEYGDLLLGKSLDGGKTFGTPVSLLRGSNGKNKNAGCHKSPQKMCYYNGRLYGSMEWGTWGNKDYGHAAMVMSIDENDDLMVPENWSFTEPVRFDALAPELEGYPTDTVTIEGNVVVTPEGKLVNIMRTTLPNQAIVLDVDTQNPENPLKFSRLMEFHANRSKFSIRYDEVSKRYYTIASTITDDEKPFARNYLTLMVSEDLIKWDIIADLYDFRDRSHLEAGVQYVQFEFEGDDIIYVCRTALNNAHTYHDSNYITFHRIRNFRDLAKN